MDPLTFIILGIVAIWGLQSGIPIIAFGVLIAALIGLKDWGVLILLAIIAGMYFLNLEVANMWPLLLIVIVGIALLMGIRTKPAPDMGGYGDLFSALGGGGGGMGGGGFGGGMGGE